MGADWFAVANPAAGGGRGTRIATEIAAKLDRAGVRHRLTTSERPGHASVLSAAAARDGCRHFLAIGGDGTLHDLVNGVLSSGIAPGEATFGLVPVGRGNDWARSQAIPRAVDQAVKVLAEGRSIAHDVGTLDSVDPGAGAARRYFVNAAGVGFDAHVVRRTSGRSMGKLSYLASLPGSLLSFAAPELEVSAGGRRFSGPAFMAFASINRYCGGGMLVAPAAVCDDGLLDILVLGRISLPELLLNVHRLYDGSLPRHPKARTFRAESLEVSGPAPVESEADGELAGASPIRFGLLPKHIRVVVP